MISAIIRRAGSLAYRLAFFTAGIYLLWRGATDTDGVRVATSLGLGSLCILQFGILVVIDYRRSRTSA